MKRVNLLEYFELAESLQASNRSLNLDNAKAGTIFFSLMGLPQKLDSFIKDDNGFTTCKRVAAELLQSINDWVDKNAMPNGQYSAELFDRELSSWEWSHITRRIDSFRSVFEAECHDIDIYSVGQIAIYKTQALVSEGANILPEEYRADISGEVLSEFNNAGKCLAFDLPTACGFHALRGLELVMDDYLSAFGVDNPKVQELERLHPSREKTD